MNTIQYLYSFLISVVIFFSIDMIWLGWIAKTWYRNKIGHLMSDQVNWTAALVFYVLYIFAVQYFAILPAIKSGKSSEAWIAGAILGGICYATYDLTNLATLKNWPVDMSIVDILWGVVLTASTAGITTYLYLRFLS